MCELHLPDALVALAERGKITSGDVVRLQSDIYPDGLNTFADAEIILAIDLASHDACPQWDAAVKNLISDFVADPSHNVDMVAQWLIRCLSRHGIIDDRLRFELLVDVIKKLDEVPAVLSELALSQVRLAACDNSGPLAATRCGGLMEINFCDAEILAEILTNSGSEEQSRISSQEMQVLYEINDSAISGLNNPAWQSLYLCAVTSFLGVDAKSGQSREEVFAKITGNDPYRLVDTCVVNLHALGAEAARPFRLSAQSSAENDRESELLASLTQFLSGVEHLQDLQEAS